MSSQPRCPHCRHFLYLDTLTCPNCEAELGFHILTRQFYGIRHGQVVIDDQTWYTCSNREWDCNWLVWEDAPAGRCFSCRLTRTRPAANDTVALEKLAKTEEAKRRLVLQLGDLGLPIVPWDVKPGGLGFDLISSLSDGKPVMIGHANGIITIDLAESLDDRREALRVRLGRAVPHDARPPPPRGRALLPERAADRRRELGAVPRASSATSARATATRSSATTSSARPPNGTRASSRSTRRCTRGRTSPRPSRTTSTSPARCRRRPRSASISTRTVTNLRDTDVVPLESYRTSRSSDCSPTGSGCRRASTASTARWASATSTRSTIVGPVRHKLAFMHDIVTRAPLTTDRAVRARLRGGDRARMTTFARGQRVIGAATHYVENQPPWRVDVDEYALNAPLRGRRRRLRRRVGGCRAPRSRRARRLGVVPAGCRAREPPHADGVPARPVGIPARRGRVRPVVPPRDRRGDRPRRAHVRVGGPASRGARRACRDVHAVRAGRARARLPGVDDPRGGRLDRGLAVGRRRMAAAAVLPRVRAAPAAERAEAQRADRHGDDREAGRLRRPRRHDRGRVDGRARVPAHRPQVVLLGADVGRLPRARAHPPAAPRTRGCRACSCRGCSRTACATCSASSGSRTSSATARTPPPRSSSTAPSASSSASRAAACGRSSRWSSARGWTACWAPPRACGSPSPRRVWHARGREAFGALLVDQPAMTSVLADLALESEAAMLTGLRLAQLFEADASDRDVALRRLATPVVEVLGVQARAAPRLRGARVPRRQRLHRVLPARAALPRAAGDGDLGGLRQRHRPRRAARAHARPRLGGGLRRGARAPRGRIRRCSTRTSSGRWRCSAGCAARMPATRSRRRAASASRSRSRSRRRSCSATRRRSTPRRSSPRGWARTARRSTACCRGDGCRSHRRHVMMSRCYRRIMTPQELENLAHLRRARDLIDRDYAKPLDVPTMAAKALMSPSHFSRRFRAAYGETPYNYLMTRRIERAMALLRDGRERHRRLHGRRLYLARLVQLAVRRDRRRVARRPIGPASTTRSRRCPPASPRRSTAPDPVRIEQDRRSGAQDGGLDLPS